ncbi:MAG: YfiR family protein [Gammaproteobacteria bacterium]
MGSRNDMPLLYGLTRMLRGLLTVLLLSAPALVAADETRISEYRVKTAFLYNFSRFVTWPQATLQDRPEFTLCVTGTDRFGAQLDDLAGKTVHEKTLVVRHLSSLAMVDDCQLVYIGENAELTDILLLLGEQPVLTVSDAAGFIEEGGIIQFILIQNKVRFRINVAAANAAGLNISSKLLSLAVSVTGSN